VVGEADIVDVVDDVRHLESGRVRDALDQVPPQPPGAGLREGGDDDLHGAVLEHGIERGGVRIGVTDFSDRPDPEVSDDLEREVDAHLGGVEDGVGVDDEAGPRAALGHAEHEAHIVGGALANRDEGRFSVSIQSDGDLLYAPGALWTAARHKIPLLAVMHNNRGYHQEVMHVQRLANFRDRTANIADDLGPVGTSIMNPDIEYHKLAESMGWWAKGPIKDPADLGPAIKEAVAVVKSGQPALVNVWTQPR